VTVYDAPKAGSLAARRAEASAIAGETAAAEEAAGNAAARAAGSGIRSTMLGVAGYLPNFINPGQDLRDSEAQFAEMNRKRLGMGPQPQSTGF
jgi:hypothetical protein